jgi:hypothetical protein
MIISIIASFMQQQHHFGHHHLCACLLACLTGCNGWLSACADARMLLILTLLHAAAAA